MKYFILLIVFLLTTSQSCDLVDAQSTKLTEIPEQETQAPTQPDKPQDINKSLLDILTKMNVNNDEMRITQVLLLINQICTDSDGINIECRKAIIKCFGDRWQPASKIYKCYEEYNNQQGKETP